MKEKAGNMGAITERLDEDVLQCLVICEHKPDTQKEEAMLRTRKGYTEESVQAEGSVSVKGLFEDSFTFSCPISNQSLAKAQ